MGLSRNPPDDEAHTLERASANLTSLHTRRHRLVRMAGGLAGLIVVIGGGACSHSSSLPTSDGQSATSPATTPKLSLPVSVAGFEFGKPWPEYSRACASIAAVLRPQAVFCSAALPHPIPAIRRLAPPRAYGYVCWMAHGHRHCLYPRDALAASPKSQRFHLYYLVNAFYGAPDENPHHQRRNTPRTFFHLMIWGGPVPDGALQLGERSHDQRLQRPLGPVTIDGHRGQLYLGVPYWRGGGEYANHYTFVWGTPNRRLVVSLHAWAPHARTLVVLRAVVRLLRPA